jgi:hypothetical protein
VYAGEDEVSSMIDIQKFIDDVTTALQSGKTQTDIEANAQRSFEVLKSAVRNALVSPTSSEDVDQIRQHLTGAQAGLNAIDFDGIHVAPAEASAVRANLHAQINVILFGLPPPQG